MLKNRNFVLLWASQCISGAGDTFTFLALSLKINDFYSDPGDSARGLSGVLIAFALPQLLFGILAGTFVDRWDRKKVMIASDLIRVLIVPGFLLINSPEDTPWAIVIAFMVSSFSVFFYPARTALLPAMVTQDELMTANGWMQMGLTVARLAGPVVAGVVVGSLGANVAFGVDSVSYLLSAFLLIGISGICTRAVRGDMTKKTPWTDIKEGVRFAVRSRLLQGVTLGISLAMLGLGALNVLFVPFIRHTFNAPAEALGGIQASQGAGMLIGGLLIGVLGKKLPPLTVAFGAMLLLGGAVVPFGLIPDYTFMYAIMPIVGFALPPLNASLQTMFQRGVPQHLLGRAGSVMDMTVTLANLISMGAAGWLGDLIGIPQTFIFSGVMLLLGGVTMAWLLKGIHLPEEGVKAVQVEVAV
jgi:DHA3 family macrolide efflux protein-like MFS transporter